MVHSPPFRPVLRSVLALASTLQAGCHYRPADAWRIHAYLGRDIREFLATGPRALTIVDEPEGKGRTYVFEYLRVDSVAVPDPRPPGCEPRPSEPWIPLARPGQPSLQPNSLHPPVPRNVSPSQTVLRTYLLRVTTDPAGIIQNFTCAEQPALP
jgi:hypothetical protein